MPSPINQARRQADFLKNYLMARSDNLLKKSLIFQASFTDFKFDILVAISDSGIINRPKNSNISEVYKADQITDEINSIISSYAGTNKNILTLKVNYHFSNTSMDKITRYLTQTHKPVKCSNKLEGVKETKAVYSTSTPDKKKETKELVHHSCSKCTSNNVEIVYGKFGYYFKCHDCNGNTSIKLKCKEASCKPKLRKQKLTFFKECAACKSSEIFFTNKESQKV
jgi:Zn finger protein HypA/HybF involved in hydrogenase expression